MRFIKEQVLHSSIEKIRHVQCLRALVMATILAACSGRPARAADSFTPLGTLPGAAFGPIPADATLYPGTGVNPIAISGDGSVVIGTNSLTYSEPASYPFSPPPVTITRPFLWTDAGGTESLNTYLETQLGPSFQGWSVLSVTALSNDGSTILGMAAFGNQTQAFTVGLPSRINWVGSQPGNWDDATKWDIQQTPVSRDNVFIGGNGIVTGPLGNVTINSLHVGGATGNATLDLQSSGSLQITAALTVNAGGTVSTHGAAVHANSLSIAGTLNHVGPGILTVDGSAKVIGGGLITQQAIGPFGPPLPQMIVRGDLTNEGTISIAQQMEVDGNFTQTHQGTLSLTVSGYEAAALAVQSPPPLSIGGQANFDGTLKVRLQSGTPVPDVGTRIPLVAYGSVASRFSHFDGSIIQDESDAKLSTDRFFGLDYQAGGGLLRGELDLITLNMPQKFSGGVGVPIISDPRSKNMIFVTHGTAAAATDWANPMAQVMQRQAAIPGDWDAVTLDWSKFAANQPNETARVGYEIGRSMADLFHEAGISYDQIHALSHSSGSWLIQGFADEMSRLDEKASASIHLTFFDVYNPLTALGYTDGKGQVLPAGMPSGAVIGLNSTGDEQYFNRPFQFFQNINITSRALPNVYNVDVADVNPSGSPDPLQRHSWPWQWYLETAQAPTDGQFSGLGFPLSEEYHGNVDLISSLEGKVTVLSGSNGFVACSVERTTIDLQSLPQVVSPTGTVRFTSQGILNLATPVQAGPQNLHANSLPAITEAASSAIPTGDPVMFTSILTVSTAVDRLSFDFQFTNNATGLLSVYFNGNEVAQIDESLVTQDMLPTGDLPLGSEYGPGTYTLLFRLDPYDDLQSIVDVSNVQLGLAVPVPEAPSVAVVSGCTLLMYGKRSRICGKRSAAVCL